MAEVADRLPPSDWQRTIVVVGGSRLAWSGFRDTTLDVDSITRLDKDLRRAADLVGEAHDLPAGWLNDHASMFTPMTFDEDHCSRLLEHPGFWFWAPR